MSDVYFGGKFLCFWHQECYNLSVTRTNSMVSFIGHFDFLSVLPVGPIVLGNPVLIMSSCYLADLYVHVAK